MITRNDLHSAIAECQGQRNPDARTCAKLASYYTILDHLEEPAEPAPMYSYDAPPERYTSESEFGRIIVRLDTNDVMRVMDELMETLRIIEPRLYRAVMEKLTALD